MSPAYNLAAVEEDIEETLEDMARSGLEPETIREMVQELGFDKLKSAMLADNDNTGANLYIKALDMQTECEKYVNVDGSLSDVIDKWDVNYIGARLNNLTTDHVSLNIGRPKNANDVVPAQYNNTVAINFSMDLEGLEDPDNLQVPVKITIPVPSSINPRFLVILHYPLGGGEPGETINPYVYQENGKWYASFVLDHFSDFVMTEKEKPASKAGDVNADGSVNATDKAILNRYLAGWKGYDAKILNWDAADIDGKDGVTATDKAILNRHLASWQGYAKYFE